LAGFDSPNQRGDALFANARMPFAGVITSARLGLLEKTNHADRAEFIGQRLQSLCPDLF
jgi:hypothetical protein